MDLSLILLNTPWGIYSVPKESKYTAVFLSKKMKSNVFRDFVGHGDLWHTQPSFILEKLSLEKAPLNLGL